MVLQGKQHVSGRLCGACSELSVSYVVELLLQFSGFCMCHQSNTPPQAARSLYDLQLHLVSVVFQEIPPTRIFLYLVHRIRYMLLMKINFLTFF